MTKVVSPKLFSSRTRELTSRRDLLRLLGGASVLPWLPSFSCGGSEATTPTGSSEAWASGGTAAMLDKASYPSPFTDALSTCALVATTTEGPCTTSSDLAREDISESWSGLPVRLALKVVDGSCKAVHIHFQVKSGATSHRISQLFFPEDITRDIFANHEEYLSYGQPDTTFSNDNIISGISAAQRDLHVLAVSRMTTSCAACPC